jgi:hypothetical protein
MQTTTTVHLTQDMRDRLRMSLNSKVEHDREILFKLWASELPAERKVFRSADEADRARIQKRADFMKSINLG